MAFSDSYRQCLAQVLLDDNDNQHVAYFNWNGKRWVLNFNWIDNDNFNSNARLVRVRDYLYIPPQDWGGIGFNNCFFHPPSWRPISDRGMEI